MRPAGILLLLLFSTLLPAQDSNNVVPPSAVAGPDSRDRVLYAEETERAGPLLKKEVRNILLDQKAIWTSPRHLNRHNTWKWVLFGGATGALIAADYHLSTQLPNSNDQKAFSSNVSQIGATYTVLPVAAGFYAFGAFKDDPKARETGALGFEAVADAAITVAIMKAIFARERPQEGSGKGRFFQWGHDGFPSGHSIQTFAAASIIAHEYNGSPWVPTVAYGLAGLVSASRFSARKHFAGDIIAGAGLGWAIGHYVFRAHDDHRIHKRYGLPPVKASLTPAFDPIARGYGMRLELTPQR